MIKIGLTGVIGAGKSSVIQILQEKGISVFDCDEINAQLLLTGARGYQALINVFHDEILDVDNHIDKQKMSATIFSDQQKREMAEQILHPLIKQEIEKQCEQHIHEDIVVVEVPLLFEIGWEKNFDECWVVTCSQEILLDRLIQYRHMSEDEARRRLQVQMPQEEKIKKAQRILYNDGNLQQLKQQINEVLEEIRK